jgi:hypothetical protein
MASDFFTRFNQHVAPASAASAGDPAPAPTPTGGGSRTWIIVGVIAAILIVAYFALRGS